MLDQSSARETELPSSSPTEDDMAEGLMLARATDGCYIKTQGDCNFAARLAERERQLREAHAEIARLTARLSEREVYVLGMEQANRYCADVDEQFYAACHVPPCPTHGKFCPAWAVSWIINEMQRLRKDVESARATGREEAVTALRYPGAKCVQTSEHGFDIMHEGKSVGWGDTPCAAWGSAIITGAKR